MRIMRIVFVLSLLVLVLPTDTRQRHELRVKLDRAVQYATTLCDQNAKACDTGSHYWDFFKQKSASSLRLARNFAGTAFSISSEDNDGTSGSDGVETDDGQLPDELTRLNRGTLLPGDLTTPWRGYGRRPAS